MVNHSRHSGESRNLLLFAGDCGFASQWRCMGFYHFYHFIIFFYVALSGRRCGWASFSQGVALCWIMSPFQGFF